MTSPVVPLSAPPIAELLLSLGENNVVWMNWFNQVYDYTRGPRISNKSGSDNMVMNYVYVADGSSLVTLTLPTSFNVGDYITVLGKGTGGWKIAQNAGQTIRSATSTTTGTAGSLSSSNRYDSVTLTGLTANTELSITGMTGTLTFV